MVLRRLELIITYDNMPLVGVLVDWMRGLQTSRNSRSENQIHPCIILCCDRQACVGKSVRVPEQRSDVFERFVEGHIVVQSPLPCRSGAIQEELVSLVCGLCRDHRWEWNNSCIIKEGNICGSVGAGIIDGWIWDIDFLASVV
jgi:hypothetical protein